MRAQRACRRFDPDGKVLDSDIEQMLQTAVHAPSAENTQPWSFIVVRDEESRKLLADWWTETWNAGGGDFIKGSLDDQALINDLEYGFNRGGFAAAPVVIVVCADTERVMEIYAAASIYPAVQNLLLAAACHHRLGDVGQRAVVFG
jgi:nitroreductase